MHDDNDDDDDDDDDDDKKTSSLDHWVGRRRRTKILSGINCSWILFLFL